MQPGDDSEHGMDASPDTGHPSLLHEQIPAASQPLPRGQHHLSPEYVAEHQSARIRDATTYVLFERGYNAATIGDIVSRARVSRRTFYAHYESKEHCVLATFDAASRCMADAVRAAYLAQTEWDAAMAAGLVEVMRMLVDFPHVAHTCFVEMRSVLPAAGPALHDARVMCTDGLRRGISERPDAFPVDDMAYELGTGGLITIVRARVAAGDPEALQRELPEITRALLRPLAGAEATEAVIARIGEASADRAVHTI